jgi:hypothetical protein
LKKGEKERERTGEREKMEKERREKGK